MAKIYSREKKDHRVSFFEAEDAEREIRKKKKKNRDRAREKFVTVSCRSCRQILISRMSKGGLSLSLSLSTLTYCYLRLTGFWHASGANVLI